MALREPFRTPAGAFQRSPLKARTREGAAVEAQPAYGWLEGSTPGFQYVTLNGECGAGGQPPGGDWIMNPPGQSGGENASFPGSVGSFAAVQWQPDPPDGVAEPVLTYTQFNSPITPWDDWSAPGFLPCWQLASPASSDPAHSEDESGHHVIFDGRQSPVEYRLPIGTAHTDDIDFDDVVPPLFPDFAILVPTIGVDVVVSPMPDRLYATGGIHLVPITWNVGATAPVFWVTSAPAGLAVARARLVPLGRFHTWEILISTSGTSPGDYVVTVDGWNAWQGGRSQTQFTVTVV